MRRLKTQASVQRCGRIPAAIIAIASISFSMGAHSDIANARPVRPMARPPVPLNRTSVPPMPLKFCPSQLESAIASIVQSPKFRTAQWGILIQPLADATTLYQHNPNLSLIPASNVKLLTTAAAIRIASGSSLQALPAFENWLTEVNRYSDNYKADALLRRVGGQTAIRNALAFLGVSTDGFAQVDGSGLSRRNRATPSTFVTLLKGMYTDDQSGLFYRSLSIAGVNGTLQNRFRNTRVQGNLHGKTGTLRGVRALSGYLDNANYGTIAFSIVVNQPGQSGQVLTQAIDQIVLKTAQVDRCY